MASNTADDSAASSHRRAAAVLGAVVLLSATVLVARPGRPRPAALAGTNVEPEDCIAQMIRAQQRGDVDAYLACFAGEFYDRLAARMDAQPRSRVCAELQHSAAGLMGHACTSREVAGEMAVITLERIFASYNERQRVRLRRNGRTWRITDVETLQRYAPSIPYGTPVVPLPD